MEKILNKEMLSGFLIKTLFVNFVNFLVLVATILLIRDLQTKSLEVKTARTKVISMSQDIDAAVLSADLERERTKISDISSLLSGETTLISFIETLDKLKKDKVISEFEFPLLTDVPDKTGARGLPIVMTIQGTKIQLDESLRKIGDLPVLLRPVTLTIEVPEASSSAKAKYSGFIYIK